MSAGPTVQETHRRNRAQLDLNLGARIAPGNGSAGATDRLSNSCGRRRLPNSCGRLGVQILQRLDRAQAVRLNEVGSGLDRERSVSYAYKSVTERGNVGGHGRVEGVGSKGGLNLEASNKGNVGAAT
jgi:hypothetical protein